MTKNEAMERLAAKAILAGLAAAKAKKGGELAPKYGRTWKVDNILEYIISKGGISNLGEMILDYLENDDLHVFEEKRRAADRRRRAEMEARAELEKELGL